MEARTAVLALTQNMEGLKDTLIEMDSATGSLADAYAKMKDTPANQVKLLKNELSSLAITMGALAGYAILPAMAGMRLFLQSVKETDPVTQGLLATMTAGIGIFALWKLGLGSIVLALKSTIGGMAAAQAAMGGLTAQFAAAKLATKGGLVISVLYTGYQLSKLISEMWQLNDAVDSNRAAADMYRRSAEKNVAFANFEIKSKEDLLLLTQQERKEYRKNLAAAMQYYSRLQASAEIMSTDAMLGGLLPFQSAAGKRNEEKAKEMAKMTDKYAKALKDSAKAAESESFNKPTEAVAATTKELETFEKAAKKAYEEATTKAEEYAQKVIAWEEKIKGARLSAADKIRELGRKLLTDEKAWLDIRLQADEKMTAARKALREGDYKNAESLAKQAESLYSSLARKVTKEDEGGKDVVTKALKDTTKIAQGGIKQVGEFLESVYEIQKKKDAEVRDDLLALAAAAKESLDELAKKREAEIEIKVPNLESMQKKLNDLAKPLTKYIHIKYVKSGSPDSSSTPVKKAVGGMIPGFGGGDNVHALLEKGEFILRKEAVAKYGLGLISKLNSLSFKLPDMSGLPKFASGGLVSASDQGLAETLVVRFQAGDMEAPVRITDPDSRMAIKQMAKEMSRMRLTYAQ
ncbi:MAG: hypothetical protein JRE40_07825 [Deltaproteobacteria bacterium]|nr:hypothetical protein [Deltaproteobacteria bacterium]